MASAKCNFQPALFDIFYFLLSCSPVVLVMTESSSVSYSREANASPAVERKAIIVSSLNLEDNLGAAFPFKCINIQASIGFQWLNLRNSSRAACGCHTWRPLRVWRAARQGCPFRNCNPAHKGMCMPHSHTQSDKWWLGKITHFLSCSLGLRTVTLEWRLGCLFLWWLPRWWEWMLFTQLSGITSFFPRQLC